jgi:hypothetical protein
VGLLRYQFHAVSANSMSKAKFVLKMNINQGQVRQKNSQSHRFYQLPSQSRQKCRIFSSNICKAPTA